MQAAGGALSPMFCKCAIVTPMNWSSLASPEISSRSYRCTSFNFKLLFYFLLPSHFYYSLLFIFTSSNGPLTTGLTLNWLQKFSDWECNISGSPLCSVLTDEVSITLGLSSSVQLTHPIGSNRHHRAAGDRSPRHLTRRDSRLYARRDIPQLG